MLDLNNFNHVDNMVYYDPAEFFDEEKYTETKEVIFSQLRDLDNLGQNLLDELSPDDSIREKILNDIVRFTKENYLNLIDKDFVLTRAQLELNSFLVYQFLCIDCYNVIIPKILEQLNIQNIVQFDKILNRNVTDNNFIKKMFLTNISEILINLQKLQNIDQTVSEKDGYKSLVTRFGNYLEFIDFSSSDSFVENYIRPLLNKHFNQLLWRTF